MIITWLSKLALEVTCVVCAEIKRFLRMRYKAQVSSRKAEAIKWREAIREII